MVRETRHLWVGNLPENVREEKIIEHFKRYGRVESVKILPKRGSEGGVAAFVDFVDIKSAQKAHNSVNKMGDRDLRTDYNEPGTIPSAARGLDDTVSIASRSREVSGFRGGGGGPTYGPPPSLHAREGRYERRLDGASDNRERAYEHSAYGHHERGTGGFDRTRHYDQDYYRDARERTLQHGLYYSSRSRSPSRFDAHDPRYEPRAREQFTLPSVVHRDIYRDDLTREVRGRRPERNYQHSRSRSPHSSQSRTQSPQRLASQASRPTRSPSGSGSRSRSSSSDSISSSSSTSSDSSDSSSSSSDESPARSVQSTAVPAPTSQLLPSLEKDEPRKSFGIKVQNLPVRSTDTSLKDGLFHEFKKYGKVTSVQIHGASEERYGLVFFRQQEDQEKALNASKGKLFFGMQIEVTAWIGPETESENEFRPLDERIDEFHPKATRTLFIGNLEKTTTYHDLRNIFQRFGGIVDIDIKKVNGVPQYAFLQYCDITSVCKAIKKMDGEYLGNNRLKVVFDRLKGMALVIYNEIEYAQAAVKETKGRKIGGNKIKVDFANRESQLSFYQSMENTGQDIRDFYEMLAERRDERRGSYEYAADRTYYEAVRTPGTYPEDPRREYPARSREFYADWDPYQAEYYDPRYYDDPREYRDYRGDPYEQDIREYSYRQRERERFESDRDRDHERRPIERSQSPAHSRRPQSPGASPSQSERLQSDSERRIYSRSSERSGSCSSLSPPRYDKLDKARLERYTKNEKPEKERAFEQERTDKDKRLVRKEKPEKLEKDKADKQKRRAKNHSPSSQSSETDPETEREPTPEKVKGSSKASRERADKEGAAKNRLELMPCVVLTRVKEKEGKVIEQPALEKLRGKQENDMLKSPLLEQKMQISQADQTKSEQLKLEPARVKVPKEKVLASHIEVVEKDAKLKPKKHLKAELPSEVTNPVDLEKLEARKRRFADANLKPDKQKTDFKRSSQEEEDGRVVLKKQIELTSSESERKPLRKETLKRESKKSKQERLASVTSPKEAQEPASISLGIGLRPSLELQARLGELLEEPGEAPEIPARKVNSIKLQHKHIQLLDDQGTEREDKWKNYCSLPEEVPDHKLAQEKPPSSDIEEKIPIDIDHTQSYRKQMELSRRLKQQMEMEIAKHEKFGSPKKDLDEYERRSLVHEVGKPPQDVTDDSPPSKRKKSSDAFDFEISTKRERNYRSSRQVSEDSERAACSPSLRPFPFHEDEEMLESPRLVPVKETKESPKMDEKGPPYSNVAVREDSLKFNPYDSSRREQMVEMAKIKLSSVSCEEELNRWESQVKQEPGRVDITFPSSIVKRDGIRKRSIRDLEPGEVPSDSDDDGDNKAHSPKNPSLLESSRLSFLLRDREEKLRDREERLPTSLERNKFYSFALDKTITPDTKALLERAKSLSSSREENWSFLDWDSRFANFRNNKDKEKVDSAPRPIPSWYMKKKKIRTDSEGKLDDKKEDHKEDEQERQELFASRFLHSSIFEQDSKRLQHLERKDEDLDFLSGRLYGRQASLDGNIGMSEFVPEPVVLFHSRFVELTRMQQKEKEKDQKPKEAEKQEEKESQPKSPEAAAPEDKVAEHKHLLSVGPFPVALVLQEPGPAMPEKVTNEKLSVIAPSLREEKPLPELGPVAEEPKPLPELLAAVKTEPPEHMEAPPGIDINKDPALSAATPPEEDLVPLVHPSYLDTKPPTPGSSFSQADIGTDPEPEIIPPPPPPPPPPLKPAARSEELPELKEESVSPPLNSEAGAGQKAEPAVEVLPPVSDTEMEAEPLVVIKDKKPYKNKRSKNPVQTSVANVAEKPVTRKSERIDREKLKRSGSPRGEALKVETEKVPRNAAKSPSAAPEPENPEPSLPVSRTRRRNVRSVYATTGDHEGPSPMKDTLEVTRPTRKRVEREPPDSTLTPTPPRRGRPPKSRRKPEEEVSPVKAEPAHLEVEEAESKEMVEVPKPVEGWRSPRSQKLAHGHSPAASSPQAKKGGKNESKAENLVVPEESPDLPGQGSNGSENGNKPKVEKEPLLSDQKRDRKEVELEKNVPEACTIEIVERKPVSERTPKSKRGRSRNVKAVDKASLMKSLKSVEIRLNVDEVKGALRPSEEDMEPVPASSPKNKSPRKEDKLSPHFIKTEAEDPFQEAEKDLACESTQSPEADRLAKQIELEQAVENIAKLTESQTIAAYKEQAAEVSDVRPEEDGDKPAHQASETELAAAIGSIIYDISGEAESFPAPPTYPTESESEMPAEPLVLPPAREEMEPETDQAVSNILESEATSAEQPAPPGPGTAPEADSVKEAEVSVSESSNSAQEAEPLQEADMARKERGRQKTSRPRRKRSTSKKGDAAAEPRAVEPERIQSKSPVANEVKGKSEGASKEESQEKSSPLASQPGPPDAGKAASLEGASPEPPVAESTPMPKAVDLLSPPVPVEEVSQSGFKLQPGADSAPVTPPPGTPNTPLPAAAAPPSAAAKPVPAGSAPLHSSTAKVTEWIVKHEEARARSTPPPALPPDTKASDIDTNSSTLRKILMEPKYVAATSVASTTHVTAAIAEPVSSPRLVEEDPPPPPAEVVRPGSEDKPAVPAMNALEPPVAEAPVFTEKEKVITVIAPKATSVISRMPHSIDLEETPRIALVKQAPQTCLVNALSPKYKQRPSTNDNSRFHPGSMSVIEDRPVETGSSPGLRVNTSEGIVLLSYSQQKTEGQQRITAKISQIPPASAVDIEFQQSVSKSQIKQEPLGPSQPIPKGSQAPTGYGSVSAPSSLVLGAQQYSPSPVLSSIKQERGSLEKSEPLHLSVQAPTSQSGPVKVLSQSANTPSILVHNQMVLPPSIASSTNKKLPDPGALKVETKTLQPSSLSPGVGPHHPSLSSKIHPEANHVSAGPSTPAERVVSHLGVTKQEPLSPRTSGHSPSPFPRACHPGGPSSPALSGNNSMLGIQGSPCPGIPVPQYISSMHPEQSVIMPPHSVTQTVSLGHLSQGEVRMNTPPLPGMPYSIRPEALHSPRAALQPQRSSTPQPAPIREIVMPPLSSQHSSEEEMHYHHTVCRGSAPVQSDVLVMQPDYRLHPSGIRIDQYNVPRDVRMMMHPHMAAVGGDHHPETRQSRTPEGRSVKTPPATKTLPSGKEAPKASEVKMAHSPHSESRLLSGQLPGLPLTQPVVVPHGVQIMHPAGTSFHDYRTVYGDMRSYHPAAQLGHPQFSGASPIGLPSRSMTPSQGLPEGEHTHPNQPAHSKTPQLSQEPKGAQAAGPDPTHHPVAVNRHIQQIDPHLHLQRSQADAGQTSYPSPVAISVKQELPSPHQAPVQKPALFIPTTSGPGAPPGLPLSRPEPQSVLKQDLAPHPVSQRPVDMVQLLTKYPIVWQGLLALKNDTAAVQLHFVSGNNVLAHRSLPAPEGGPPLRIAQRMRLEASQLEGVARRMMVESDYCLLLALPCGRDQEDVVNQTESLKAAFISYLQAKQAAGIINVPNPGSNQPAYVLQIFPPCEFSESHLSRLAPDLLASISNISPHLMIVIASV
ncbi:msx2-interacting protein isoform X3 [Zootoca vivipara]|uniref:msx2-interacting protein isoform X3 n=1 Tax=Zootoca vivipara TaxID=8524 RepID=UPI00293B9666|nr:msx2-interacting protein isoform X3 [Zootoca vivipara]